jgi:hypothetical protein
VTSPTYDPTGRPAEPGPEQYGTEQITPPVGEAVQPGMFAESELEYGTTEAGRAQYGAQYGEPTGTDTGSGSTVDTAKSEAVNVKDTAVDAAGGVKDVAKGEVTNVAEEAKYQARNLVDQARSELRGQAGNQQSVLADKLHGWASELGSMASKSDGSGPMSDVAQEASRRVGEFSHWLENHEPADLLDEVKRYARRKPGTFLALCAAAGVVAGRLTRGAVGANTSVDSDREATPARAYDGGAYDYESAAPSGAGYGTRSYQDGDYAPRYGDTVPTGASYQGAGTAVPEQLGATGTSFPNVTPVGDEAIYPPPTEGEVGR